MPSALTSFLDCRRRDITTSHVGVFCGHIRVQTLPYSAHLKLELTRPQPPCKRMMCGACVSRVKNILSADERVDSVVVNMLTETAAVKLKKLDVAQPSVLETDYPGIVAEALAGRLTECGFPTIRRVSGMGMVENVRKLKDLAKKKEELLAKSRNRVAFAWTLVALCCGSHASHILHSLGIHIAHGNN